MGHFSKTPDSPAGPEPLTGVTKVPGQTPPGWKGAGAGLSFPPPDRSYSLLEGWEFGPFFEPYTIEGNGPRMLPWGDHFPDGPFLLEAAHQGDGHFSILAHTELDAPIPDLYFNVLLRDFRGSTVPQKRRPKLKVSASNAWILRVKPVAAARRLTGTMTGYGHEALLYTGPATDLRVRFRGREAGRHGHVGLWCHEVGGETELREERRSLLLNETSKAKCTVRLPEGPLLLRFNAEGDWTLTVEEPRSQSR
ncbi:hypothetical protein [Streptomyces vietnamensis]|uniref:hypothetical protein n=1 Tax=Streptomyces vietnamensis TaxID=362257 RepID=UPI000B172F83|nr:hypothetical protein [Streptomyces vietnamensis]